MWCCSDTDIEQLGGLARTEITKAMERKNKNKIKCESNVKTEQAYMCFSADANTSYTQSGQSLHFLFSIKKEFRGICFRFHFEEERKNAKEKETVASVNYANEM